MAIRTGLLAGAAALALFAGALPAMARSPAQSPTRTTDDPPATQPTAGGGLSPGQLAMLERVSDPRLSPDGRRVLYNVRTTDWISNRGVTALWVVETDGTSRRLAASDGSRDFRVPVEQGLGTFSALQHRGIESRFVHVPDENHWVLKPRNWVDWQQEILDWTAHYTAE